MAAPPYAGLTPDRVLDALDSVGVRGDGRLLALNSYENRVYQVWRDDAPPVVAKFYRPARWSDEQIAEEHDFVAELAEAEVPVVPPLPIDNATLHSFEGFRFAVYERRGGRAPELEDRDTLVRIGRFVARIHVTGHLTIPAGTTLTVSAGTVVRLEPTPPARCYQPSSAFREQIRRSAAGRTREHNCHERPPSHSPAKCSCTPIPCRGHQPGSSPSYPRSRSNACR